MKSARTILFVSHTGVFGGGAEVVLGQTIEATRSLGCRCVLAGPSGELLAGFQRLCDEVYLLPLIPLRRTTSPIRAGRMLLGWLRTTMALARIISRSKADVVHANSGAAALACLGATFFLHKPLIWHQHDIVPCRWINRLILGTCGHGCTLILAVSRAVKDSLTRLDIPEERVTVLHNAVRPEFFAAPSDPLQSRRTFGLPKTGPVIGMAGRLVPYKGHRLLIEAVRLLKDRGVPVTVAVAGGPPVYAAPDVDPFPGYERDLHDLVEEHGLTNELIFLGRQQDMPNLLGAFDVLCVPSIDEPFPLVVLEGMAAGKVVVAADSGGNPEAIEDGVSGYLFRSGDAESLASTMERTLKDPEGRKQLGEAARVRAQQYFGEPTFRKRLAEIYDDVR